MAWHGIVQKCLNIPYTVKRDTEVILWQVLT